MADSDLATNPFPACAPVAALGFGGLGQGLCRDAGACASFGRPSMSKTDQTFNTGDIVYLLSGSRPMTFAGEPPHRVGVPGEWLRVIYGTDDGAKHDCFPREALTTTPTPLPSDDAPAPKPATLRLDPAGQLDRILCELEANTPAKALKEIRRKTAEIKYLKGRIEMRNGGPLDRVAMIDVTATGAAWADNDTLVTPLAAVITHVERLGKLAPKEEATQVRRHIARSLEALVLAGRTSTAEDFEAAVALVWPEDEAV